MPEIALVESIDIKKNFLKNLLNSIVLKDIVERYNIRDTSLLLKLLSYLADNVGSLVSSVNIANVLQQQLREKVSVKTITNYLRYFEIPYLINEVERYDIKGKRILEYTGKYYFTDI
ncbi:MAG: hypothetical protein LBU27_07430 [Candidatus Peribacteria bacterium]|jgi:predicted AAA+ superfamily ATPase|nr:hypothetical protein [Candidatus Peribacteria bacterium]